MRGSSALCGLLSSYIFLGSCSLPLPIKHSAMLKADSYHVTFKEKEVSIHIAGITYTLNRKELEPLAENLPDEYKNAIDAILENKLSKEQRETVKPSLYEILLMGDLNADEIITPKEIRGLFFRPERATPAFSYSFRS